MTLSAYVFVAGTMMLAVWILITDGVPPIALSPITWIMLIAVGLLATAVTTILWNWGLSHVPASQAGVFLNLEPVVGTIVGVTVLHETLGMSAIVGGVLIVTATVVVSMNGQS